MTKLNDLQLILLTSASQRDDRSILPPPDNLADQAKRVRQAITTLIKRGLIAEIADVSAAKSWREEGGAHVGVVITDAGLAAIGVPAADSGAGSVPADPPTATPAWMVAQAPRSGTKQAQLIDLLKGDGGASITELAEALGWLPHTTRAALTGLRKKSYPLTNERVDGIMRYRLSEAA